VVAMGYRGRADLNNCHVSGAFIGRGGVDIGGGASVTLRRCTVQAGLYLL
jgi:hypothetical protein